jgi:Tfp pilus assembly protein PilE
MKRKQKGLTLLGFVIVLAVVGFFAYVAMKLFPMYSEYYSVRAAMKGLSNEAGIANQDPARIQDLFFRRLYINYSENVKKEHVKLKRVDNGWQMDVQYEVRKPLVANLDVVGKFQSTQMLTRAGSETN